MVVHGFILRVYFYKDSILYHVVGNESPVGKKMQKLICKGDLLCDMRHQSKRDIFGVVELVLRPVRPVQDTTAITLSSAIRSHPISQLV